MLSRNTNVNFDLQFQSNGLALKLMDPVAVTSNALNTWCAYRVTSEIKHSLLVARRSLVIYICSSSSRDPKDSFCNETKRMQQ